jgi:hypothetical protein
LPAFEGRSVPFDVVVPASFELTARPVAGGRAPFTGSRQQVLKDVEAYREAGVTGMTVGFRSRSLAEQLEKMQRFVEEVAPEFASG